MHFDEAPPYEALSYVCGTDENPEHLLLHDCRFAIAHNLAQALRHFRQPCSDRMLWADAICINQCNPAEKNEQVQSMHWVYQRAARVVAWLGILACNSETAFTIIDHIEKNDPLPLLMSSGNGPKAVKSLMDRDYWSRSWIVQEIAFSSSLWVQCGFETVPYSALEHALYLAASTVYGVIIANNDENTSTQFTFSKAHNERLLQPGSGYNRISSKLVLDRLLGRQCEDRRDNIFAFFNLFRDNIQQRVQVDYSLDPKEVLLQAARAIIESTKSLYIITIRGRQNPTCGKDKWQRDMPSWCPYFATSYESCSITALHMPSLRMEQTVEPFPDSNTLLSVSGFVIGTISKQVMRKTCHEKSTRDTTRRLFGDIQREWNHYLACLRLVKFRPPDASSTFKALVRKSKAICRVSIAITRTVLAGRDQSRQDELSLIRRAYIGEKAAKSPLLPFKYLSRSLLLRER